MLEKDKLILERFAVIIPQLSDSEKTYQLGFVNGMATVTEEQNKQESISDETIQVSQE